jgi:glycosyltransferase involved in cell wall biosynthesis
LAAALAEQGHRVRLYLRRQTRQPILPAKQVELVELPAGPPTELTEAEAITHVGAFIDQLARALRRERPDIVHSHSWLAGLATTLAMREDHSAVPVVHTFHRLESLGNRAAGVQVAARGRLRAELAVAQQAAAVVARTDTHRRLLIGAGVSHQRITVIPPGVDAELFSPGEPAWKRTQAHRLVAFGAPERTAALIPALTALPNTDLVLNNPSGTPPAHADQLNRLAQQLDVADRLRLNAPSTPDKRAALLRSADVTVSLAAPGRLGYGHLEAMACGVAVAAGDAATESVVDTVTGIHLADTQPAYLARKLRGLLVEETVRQAMGVAGRDRATSRYNWLQIATETTQLYRHAIDHRLGKADTAASARPPAPPHPRRPATPARTVSQAS